MVALRIVGEAPPGDTGFTFESDRPDPRNDQAWANLELIDRIRSIHVTSGRPRSGARMSDHLGLVLELPGPR